MLIIIKRHRYNIEMLMVNFCRMCLSLGALLMHLRKEKLITITLSQSVISLFLSLDVDVLVSFSTYQHYLQQNR